MNLVSTLTVLIFTGKPNFFTFAIMRRNKKLTYALLLAAISVLIPLILLLFGFVFHFAILLVAALTTGPLALVMSTIIFFRFMQFWDEWENRKTKITGIVVCLIGMVLGIYSLLVIYELNFHYT